MTTPSQNQIASMLHMRQPEGLPHGESAEETLLAGHSLHDLSAVATRALHGLALTGEDLVHALEVRLEALQDTFMALLQRQMAKARLNPQAKMHLYLSPEGRLMVEGDSEDVEGLCQIISQKPLLQHCFQEMAQLAILAHGLEVATQAHKAFSSPSPGMPNPLWGRYHMCLKGTLSHFYIR